MRAFVRLAMLALSLATVPAAAAESYLSVPCMERSTASFVIVTCRLDNGAVTYRKPAPGARKGRRAHAE